MNTRSFAAVLISVVACAAPAAAGEHWRIEQSAGGVSSGTSGMTPVAIVSGATLPDGAWVQTDGRGRALLVRGSETIMLAPNSRVALPAEEVNGNTQVLQNAGSALYQIGKQQKPHFQVNTPNLAAVVKGTTFTVTVEHDGGTVAVEEGLVEVSTPDHAAVEFVRPGFSGTVANGAVTVTKTDDAAPPRNGANAKPGERSAANTPPSGIVIAAVIGETAVNVSEVSKGLASLAAPHEKSEKADDKDNASDTGVESATLALAGDGSANGEGNANANAFGNNGASIADTAPDLGSGNGVGGGNSNAGGGGSNAGGNGNAGGAGSSNAGGNGNAGGAGNSNAGGNGKGH